MLPKKGRKLPAWEGALADRKTYAEIIARLLKKEHGDSHRAVKQLMYLTLASERSVKHWLAAQHGPDTVFFLRLVATSPVIRAFVLGVIESRHLPNAAVERSPLGDLAAERTGDTGKLWPQTDPENVSVNDPINVPVTVTLNDRQRWFLARVASRVPSRASDIVVHWGVSLKTARRDIAGLSEHGLLRFVGACKKGTYHLTS